MNTVELIIKAVDQASSTLNKIKGELGSLDDTGKKTSSKSGGLGQFAEKFFYIGNAANMVIGTIQNVGSTINRFTVSAAADMESTSAAFETLIGNTELARDTIKQIQDLGASTPFQFPELADAGRKLIAFGTSAEDVRDSLSRVGDIASGIQQPIGEIAEIYGKAQVQQTLFMEDINQLTGRGIPIIQELAKQFGVAESEVKALVSSGKVTFDNLEQAFIDMTSEGGKFNGMMEKQSQTFNGLVSTLQDNVTVVLTRIGAKIIETFDLKGALEGGINFINANMPLIEGVIDTAFTAITTAIGMGKQAVSQFSDEFSLYWSNIQVIWNSGLKPTLEALGPLFTSTFKTAGIAVQLFMDIVTGITSAIAALLEGDFQGFVSSFVQLGKDMVQGLINGITSMFTGVKDTVVNLGGNIVKWFQEKMDMHSPSKVMLEQGKFLLEGLIDGLQDPALRAELQAEINSIGSQLYALQLAAGNINPTTRVPGTTLTPPAAGSGTTGTYVPEIIGLAKTFVDYVYDEFEGLPNNLFDPGDFEAWGTQFTAAWVKKFNESISAGDYKFAQLADRMTREAWVKSFNDALTSSDLKFGVAADKLTAEIMEAIRIAQDKAVKRLRMAAFGTPGLVSDSALAGSDFKFGGGLDVPPVQVPEITEGQQGMIDAFNNASKSADIIRNLLGMDTSNGNSILNAYYETSASLAEFIPVVGQALGSAIRSVGSLVNATLGDMSNGAKQIQDMVNQIVEQSSVLGQTVVEELAKSSTIKVSRGGILGFLGFTKDAIDKEVFEFGLGIATSLANAVVAGLLDGGKAFNLNFNKFFDQIIAEAIVMSEEVQMQILKITQMIQDFLSDGIIDASERAAIDAERESFRAIIEARRAAAGLDIGDITGGGNNTNPTAPRLPTQTVDPGFIGRMPQPVQMAFFTPLIQPMQDFTAALNRFVQEGITVNVSGRGSGGGITPGPKGSPTVRFRTA